MSSVSPSDVRSLRADVRLLMFAAMGSLLASLVLALINWIDVLMSAAEGAWRGPFWVQGWLETLAFNDAFVHLVTLGLVVAGLVLLRRGADSPVPRAMYSGGLVAAVVLVGLHAAFILADFFEYDGWTRTDGAVTAVRAVLALVDRLLVGFVLLAVLRVRQGWGRPPGLAWTIAAVLWALLVALRLVLILELWRPDFRGLGGAAYFGIIVADAAVFVAALWSFARAAPPDPPATRWRTAADGLLRFRWGVVAKVVLQLSVVGFSLMGALMGVPVGIRQWLLLAAGMAGLVFTAVQISGLARYADAPAPIARGFLGVALTGIAVGVMVDSAMLMVLARSEPGAGGAYVDPKVVSGLTGAGQLVGLLVITALLASFSRASRSAGDVALSGRFIRVGVAGFLLALAALGVMSGLAGASRGAAPLWFLGSLVLLAVAIMVFLALLRALTGLAEAMRQAALSPETGDPAAATTPRAP